MDLVVLARLQFAFTVGFHILWPTFTIGLASFIALLSRLQLVAVTRATEGSNMTTSSSGAEKGQCWKRRDGLESRRGICIGP
jgi:Cytochrome bd terminal oxidase subunit I